MIYRVVSEVQYEKEKIRKNLIKKIKYIENTLAIIATIILHEVKNNRFGYALLTKEPYAKSLEELAELRIFSGIVARTMEDLAEDFFYAAFYHPEIKIKQEIPMSCISKKGTEKNENGIFKIEEVIINQYVLTDKEVYNFSKFLESMKESIEIYKEIK